MKQLLFAVLLLGIALPAQAQIPRVLSYQGVFSDTLGTPKPDGMYSFTFSLYEASSGDVAKWTETKNLQVKYGLFSTLLGDATPFGTAVTFDRPYWLGITPGSDPELVPRIALSSAGYSIKAIRADTAAYALSTPVQPTADSSRIAGEISLPFHGTTAGGTAFWITNTDGSGIFAEGFTGPAVEGYSTAGTGVYGSTEWSIGVGVYGRAYSTTGLTYGVFGSSESTAGIGGFFGAEAGSGTTYGVYGRTLSTTGYGVYGLANAGSGINHGVYGGSNSSNGAGVSGVASSATGLNFGVRGTTESTSGIGGYFRAVAGSGSTFGVYGETVSTTGIGVYGVASVSSGTNFGVYGSTGSASGYAGYFSGNVQVAGTMSKSAGSFKIDHPLDPANKYLSHSFVESPDMMNIYNGNVQLDGSGEAWVELPDWFDALNKDFRYQLTCIGGFAPVYVASEIETNRFRIAGGNPGLKVSWQVTGIRKDAYAEKHRIQVEEEKRGDDKGLYLNPEAFGMTKEMGVPAIRAGVKVAPVLNDSVAVPQRPLRKPGE